MEWHDQALILGAKLHGENGAIVHLFSQDHGRCAGFLPQISSKKLRGIVQPGRTVRFSWMARLAEQTGTLRIDEQVRPIYLIDQSRQLSALNSILSLLDVCLQDTLALPELYASTHGLLQILSVQDQWHAAYVKWEFGLLRCLGYGIDLGKCALGGDDNDLAYVSPKTGRAASREEGQKWHDQLFALPRFMTNPTAEYTMEDIHNALRLSSHFIFNRILLPTNQKMPLAREYLQEKLKP